MTPVKHPLEIRRHLGCCGITLVVHPEILGTGWEGEVYAKAQLDAMYRNHKQTCPQFELALVVDPA